MIRKEFNKELRAPREAMDQLQEMMDNGDRIASIDYIRGLLLEYPQDVYLYMHAANSFSKLSDIAQNLGQIDEANEMLGNSLEYTIAGLKIKDNDVRLLTHAAKIFREFGEYENSENFYRRAIRTRFDDKYTWHGMGDLFAIWAADDNADLDDDERSDLFQDAANSYAQAFAIDPSNKITYQRLEELAKDGFRPTREGYDIGDDALKLIRERLPVKPQNLPAPPQPSGP